MSHRHFDSTENVELRAKIDEAKRRLRLPQLLERLGLGAHAKKSARCPFPGHDDKRPSFSVFQGEDGFWHYNCFSSCGSGDEIMFLRKLKGLSLTKAMNLYLEMAGFPAQRPKSREYPELPKPPKPLGSPQSLRLSESPCVSVYPVSNGQGLDKELETELKGLAARNACTERNTATTRRFKLLRDLKKVEKQIGRELTIAERRLTCKNGIGFRSRLSIRKRHSIITLLDFCRSDARFALQRTKACLGTRWKTSQNSQSLICR
jgi:hypothetical protein